MPRVQLWGYRCERCGHEWVPRAADREPRVCPRCKSPYWDRPRRSSEEDMTYEEFRDRIEHALSASKGPLTWTQIRDFLKLPQKFPNNRWVRRLETDIGLTRQKRGGVTLWSRPTS